MDMNNWSVQGMHKFVNQIDAYFSGPAHAPPPNIAAMLRMAPQHVQERMFELSLAFIQECARGEMYSDNMKHYQELSDQIGECMADLYSD